MQSAIEMYILKLKFFAYLYIFKFHHGSYLDQEPQVNILTFGLLPVNLTVLVVSDVNSLLDQTIINYTQIKRIIIQKTWSRVRFSPFSVDYTSKELKH